MNKKSGITLTVLAVSIAVMLLLITASTIIGSGYVNDARYDGFKTMISVVSDNINAYLLENGELPTNNESVLYNSFDASFAKEVEKKGDQYNRLFIVDVTKLNNYTINEGKGNTTNGDVFLIAENSNNIYYLKGFKYKDKIYYGLEAEEYDLTNQSLNVSQDDYVRDGLILYYDAINNTGSGHNSNATTWKDLSGNGNDGILVGNPTWNESNLYFDGSAKYIDIGDKLKDIFNSGMTLELIANFDSTGNARTIILGNYPASTDVAFEKGYSPRQGRIYYNNWEYNYHTPNDYFDLDKIALYTFKFDKNNNNCIFYNNSEKKYNTESEKFQNNINFVNAKFFTDNRSDAFYTKAKIYSIRVYNRALSDNEIRSNFLMDKEKYGIEADLKDTTVNMSKKLGYVTFGLLCQYDGIYNDGENHSNTTSTWKDASGRGNDATLSNFSFSGKSNWVNNGLVNDEGEGRVTTSNLNIPAASDLTVSVTFKEDEHKVYDGTNVIILAGNLNWKNFNMHTYFSDNSTKIIDGSLYIGGSSNTTSGIYRIDPGDMNGYKTTVGKTDNITYTYNSDTKIAKLYINGSFVNSKVYNDQPEAITNFLTGVGNAKTYYNIMIYDRALDVDEVQKNFAIDKRRYGIE